jgi:ABC-type branched-subunit amino acid transport system permease subunit
VAIAVPLIAAFIATIAIKKHADEIRFEFASAWTAAISLGLSVGLVAALEMGALAFLASGSAGPGRLENVGVNPWILMVVVFVETAGVSILAAFFSARPDRADHPLLN